MTTLQKSSRRKPAKTLMEEFLAELECHVETGGNAGKRLTKGQALIQSMVNEALNGDPKMLAHVLKLLDKMPTTREGAPAEPGVRQEREEWISLFAFFGKYKALIEQEIERLKERDPAYWSFDWFHPSLESAPWYAHVHGANI